MSSALEKVTVYKTTDGELFERKDHAIFHQRKENLRRFFIDLVETEGYRDMDKSDIVGMLIDNIDKALEVIEEPIDNV